MRYVLLMRHGTVERYRAATRGEDSCGGAPARERPILVPHARQGLSDEGQRQVIEVAGGLAGLLGELPEADAIRIGAIYHGTYLHTAHTALLVADTLLAEGVPARPERRPYCALDPRPGHPAEPASGGFGPYQAGTKEHENVVGLLEDHLCGKVPAEAAGIADERERHGAPPDRRAPNALLVVGHQPQLGWIAYRLLGRVVPIAHAELVSIAQDEEPRRRLWPRRLARTDPAWWRRYAPHGPRWLWSLAPRDDATTEALRKKIAAKMEIAKLLGALVIAALGWFLSFSLDQSKLAALRGQHAPLWALYAATGLFFAALALYLATMYAYDRLLMPTRFWGDREPVPTHRRPRWLARRPPSSATLVLYQNMVRVWNGLFMPATVAVIGGLLFLAYVVFRGGRAFAGIALLVLIAFFLYYRHAQPRLGTDD